MANLQISIKDADTARRWLEMVQGINEDYNTAMKDAGDTLVDMQNFADGTIVDDFVNYGTALLDAAQATFNVVNTIADTVNNILDKVANFTENVVGSIGGALGKVFGK